jgi:hypothetical protein
VAAHKHPFRSMHFALPTQPPSSCRRESGACAEQLPSFPEAPVLDFVGVGSLARECSYSWRSALSPSYFGSEAGAVMAIMWMLRHRPFATAP